MKDRIYKWWKFEGKFYHRDLIEGIKNLIKWFPIIWKIREWDWRYTLDILQQKLKFQSDWTEKHGIHLHKDEDIKWMRLCVKLIEKVKNGDYEIEYMDFENKKWDFISLNDGSDNSFLKNELIWEKYDEYFFKNKSMHKKTIEYLKQNQTRYCIHYSDKGLQAHTLSKLKHVKAKRLLFKILDEKIETFWD